MKEFLYGKQKITRRSIPAELSDLSDWPSVDDNALNEEGRDIFLKRSLAISLFVEELDVSIGEITNMTGVGPGTLYRLFERCIQQHEDGRIFGFRALTYGSRVKVYTRLVSVPPGKKGNGAGTSGAFRKLLSDYPDLDEWLKKKARSHCTKNKGKKPGRLNIPKLHKKFLEKCRELGVRVNEYPFNQDYLGKRSLSKYFSKYITEDFRDASISSGVFATSDNWVDDIEKVKKPATHPFEIVEFDGHKVDVRLTIKINDPYGIDTLIEISRIWVLVLLDVATRAVLGYFVALGKEYNMDDVAEAIQDALMPHEPRDLRIPGLSYRKDGGFPSYVIPETAYLCWDWFRFDNAKSHLAKSTISRLTRIVGCWPDAGPFKDPNERAFIESFFRYIGEHLSHRLPGTTGSSPNDIRRILNDPNGDISLLVELDELEELIDVILSDYNGTSHDGLGGRTPLEAMKYLMGKNDWFPRYLSKQRQNTLCLLQESYIATIRGGLKTGKRPHINFKRAVYSNEVMSAKPGLIGRKVRIYYNIKDLRRVRAFFEDGTELGILMANKPWCFTPHSLRTRQEINRLKELGKLHYREEDDPVEIFMAYKRKKATHNKTIANSLAKSGRDIASAKHRSNKESSMQSPDKQSTTDVEGKDTKHHDPKIKSLRINKTVTFK